ncbi:MAG: hypothetical protein V4792_09880 [Pseudomonadota bacterium]
MNQLHILMHSLGLQEDGTGTAYRNHFVTGEGSTDWPTCCALVESGLMRRRAGNELSGGDDVFWVTDSGREYVAANKPVPPKLTRSQKRYSDFLAADSDMRFGEWLRSRAGA